MSQRRRFHGQHHRWRASARHDRRACHGSPAMVMPFRAAVQVQEREGPPRRSSPEFGKMIRDIAVDLPNKRRRGRFA
jgi:hypothetical protein